MQQSLLRLAILVAFLLAHSGALLAQPFSFVALGDTAYTVPDDYPQYRKLIAAINQSDAAFSIHIGDTKGAGDCGDEFQLSQKEFFDSYRAPVVYAFGNNEWADCWKDNRGQHDPLVVLDSMRKIFYPQAHSLGANPMPLARQSDGEGFSDYAENVRWENNGVSFITVNVVGEHNNQFLRDEKLWREFVDREKANVNWINAVFESAKTAGDKAIVIAMHSDIFREETDLSDGPFAPIKQAIAEGARLFDGQVLVVHGHRHTFIIDRPLRVWDGADNSSELENVTRLQVYGWPDMRAVRVTVDISKPWVFGFEPLYTEPSLSPAFQD
jgi:hypothetical protein